MPAELRHIVFSTGDLIEAVAEQQKLLGDPFNSKAVSDFDLYDSDNGPCIKMIILHASTGAERVLELDSSELAVAVMKYCFIKRIPLPKYSEKSLHRVNDQLALMISMGGKTRRFHMSGEGAKLA